MLIAASTMVLALLFVPPAHASQHHHSTRAHAAIVGGSAISIQQAPWQVAVQAFISTASGGESLLCGGSILDATHVLTAAHCVYDPTTNLPLQPSDFLIVAGVSDLSLFSPSDAEQDASVDSIRVHPYYNYASGAGAPDDVAVLSLPQPLDLSSPATQAIALAPATSTVPENTPITTTGFGQQDPNTDPDGQLYTLSGALVFGRECGASDNAVWLCETAGSGSVCRGDSGSGLTTGSTTPTLTGVTSFFLLDSSNDACTAGSIAGFTNLTAPEIRAFIDGSDSPPQAPRGGGMSCVGTPMVNYSITCQPGTWSNTPTITYTFADSASGQVLQTSSSPSYQLTTADVGRRIYGQVQASNAGGVGLGRTTAFNRVVPDPSQQPPPPPPPPPNSGPPPYTTPLPTTLPPFVPTRPGLRPTITTSQSVGSATQSQEPVTISTDPGTNSMSLAGANIVVQSNSSALVKLNCQGANTCSGKLALSAQLRAKRGSKGSHTVTLGSTRFSIAGDSTATVKVSLKPTGRALLNSAHGHLSAHLTLVQLAPGAVQTQTDNVHLVQRKLAQHH